MPSTSIASAAPFITRRRAIPPAMGLTTAADVPAPTAQPTAAAILSALTDAVITTDRAGRVNYMNPAAERASGWIHTDVRGERLARLLRRDPRRARRVEDGSTDSGPRVYQLICRSGAVRTIEVCEAVLADERGRSAGRVFVCRDVSVAAALSEALHHGALHDALTGLTNRRGLLERLQDGLATAERLGTPLAVCFLDVDGLKAVNDVEGHGGGDQLLRSIAHRLSASVRASDTVARIGGDEFVVVLHRLEHARDAAVVTQSLTRRLARPHRIGGKLLAATASLGWGFYPDDGRDAQSLLATADRAMYQAKRARVSAYPNEIGARAKDDVSAAS